MAKRNSVPEAILRKRLYDHQKLRGDREEQLTDEQYLEQVNHSQAPPPAMVYTPPTTLSAPRKSLQENTCLLKTSYDHAGHQRRKSFDVAADSDRRPSVLGSLISRLPAMKKTEQKSVGCNKTSSKQTVPRASPLMGKKTLLVNQDGGLQNSQSHLSSSNQVGGSLVSTSGTAPPNVAVSSHEELGMNELATPLADTGSDTGTDEVDGLDPGSRTKQVISALQTKIVKTKEAIKKEQVAKEAIVNEYLQMTVDKQPTPRIKTLFEKKNQKSAQNIMQLQRKLENYQHRLQEVELHGYSGHKQAKEVLRDVGQGLNTIVSKPREFAHLIKNRFGSADNINNLSKFYIELDDNTDANNKTGTLPASFKYTSDDETSSLTSGSGPAAVHGSPHSNQAPHASQTALTVNQGALDEVMEELRKVREESRRSSEVIAHLTCEFEEYKSQMQGELSLIRSLLGEEKYRVERVEEQLIDLTELHQHEVVNVKQDLVSMEEKIEYRLDERTTDLSDLVDSANTRISRLEQQQQQQQILSMEMVENATFRTIISKLINVLLALLAVVLVFVSTAANFLSPFIHSKSRVLISVAIGIGSWLLYSNYSTIQSMTSFVGHFFTDAAS